MSSAKCCWFRLGLNVLTSLHTSAVLPPSMIDVSWSCAFLLAYRGRNKNCPHVANDILKIIFLHEYCCIVIPLWRHCSLFFIVQLTMRRAMVWNRFGDRSFCEPMAANIIDAYMRHSAAMASNIIRGIVYANHSMVLSDNHRTRSVFSKYFKFKSGSLLFKQFGDLGYGFHQNVDISKCRSHEFTYLFTRSGPHFNIRYDVLSEDREVSKPRDWQFKLSHRLVIWQARRQQCCRGACHISERPDNSKYKSRSFETTRDLTIRRLIWYWNGTLE